MARKTDEERLKELEEKIEQAKAKKQQIKSRLSQKARKERTRRLIQIGAIFEGYFVGKDNELPPEQAEKIAYRSAEYIKENLEDFLKTDVEKSKEQKRVIYEEEEEKIKIPIKKGEDYKVNKEGEEEENEKD